MGSARKPYGGNAHARDYERLIQHSETLITWAAITLITRRLARNGATLNWRMKSALDDA